jgi:hypothetical protein
MGFQHRLQRYAPSGTRRIHATVIQLLEIALGSESSDMLAVMDRMRRKRNRATYDMAGTIGSTEAREAISVSEKFVELVHELVNR